MLRLMSTLVITSLLVTLAVCCDAINNDLLFQTRNAKEEVERRCRFRNFEDLYPANELWRYLAGGACYNFTQPPRLRLRIPIQLIRFQDVWVPFIEFEGEPLLFDYTLERNTAMIRRLFVNERFFYLWRECSELGVACCDNEMNATNVMPNDEFVCPALWDGWDCWPQARANETLRRTCPEHSYTSEEIICTLESERYCLEDDWNHRTNYETCAMAPILRRRHSFHVYALAVSVALSFPAIVIFFTFMRNHKDLRHILFRVLLIAIVLKNVFTITSKEVIILDSLRHENDTMNVMTDNGVGCRVLSFFNNFATNSVFMFMLMVGYFLHSTIARVFNKSMKINIAYIISFIGALVPALDWAIAMGASQQENCWVIDSNGFHWINDIYRYAVLIANLILLIDIIRVICMQRSKLNTKQTRSAVKAILVLIPLFGVPLLLTSQRGIIDHSICAAGDAYYYVAYTVEALQGVIVALIFCYLSTEVHVEIKKWYRRFIIGVNDRFGTDFNVPTQARVTTMTNVRSSVLDNALSNNGTRASKSLRTDVH